MYFTLLTYSLLQMYLRREDLQKMTHQIIQNVKDGRAFRKKAVLVYAKDKYARFRFG